MRLREQIVKANLLVREASYIAEELDKRTEYKVTLQIPASSLDANRKVRLRVMEETDTTTAENCCFTSVKYQWVCPHPHLPFMQSSSFCTCSPLSSRIHLLLILCLCA